MKKKITLSAIATIIPVIIGTIFLVGKADSCIDNRIKKIVNKEIDSQIKPDLEIIKNNVSDIKIILEIINKDNSDYSRAKSIIKERD
jgi:hypothetical protein